MKINGITIDTVPITSVNTVGLIPNIYAVPFKIDFCPHCGEILRQYTHAIPVSKTDCAKLNGRYCHKCDAFFYHLPRILHALDTHIYRENSFRFLYDYDVNYDASMYRNIYNKKLSAQFQITILGKQLVRTYTIVGSKAEEDTGKDILHYTNPVALELLTAIILHNRKVEIDGVSCTIENVHSKINAVNNNAHIHILDHTSPVVVHKKRNGGYYDTNPNIEFVHGLVFCSNSNRLELLSMSYDREAQIYFVDSQVYDNFCLANGIPYARYISLRNGEHCSLRERSILNMLGYNVGKLDDYSENQRRQLLIDAVDMGFCDVHAIEKHLSSLISRNGKKPENHDAREKWKQDREFITRYHPNPDRFVFVSKIHDYKKC